MSSGVIPGKRTCNYLDGAPDVGAGVDGQRGNGASVMLEVTIGGQMGDESSGGAAPDEDTCRDTDVAGNGANIPMTPPSVPDSCVGECAKESHAQRNNTSGGNSQSPTSTLAVEKRRAAQSSCLARCSHTTHILKRSLAPRRPCIPRGKARLLSASVALRPVMVTTSV